MLALFTANTRARLGQHDSGWFWKFILRACSMVLSLVTIILLAVTISKDSIGVAYFLFIPLVGSIIYMLITIPLTLRRAKPVHPGANVAVDLILWLLFGLIGLYSIGASELLNTLKEYDQSTDYVRACGSNPGDSSCDSFYDYYKGVAKLLGAAGGLSVILAIIHFVLFVAACVDTHRHNRKRRMNVTATQFGSTHGAVHQTVPPPYGGAPPPAYPMQPMQPPSQQPMQPPGPIPTTHYAPK